MTLVKWNPNRSLISDFDRIFDNMLNINFPIYGENNSYSPAVDIHETEKEIILSADMPGLNKKHVSIDVKVSITVHVKVVDNIKKINT